MTPTRMGFPIPTKFVRAGRGTRVASTRVRFNPTFFFFSMYVLYIYFVIYQGDVVPTVGGGAQIIFNDVETLKQTSPMTSPTSPKQKPTPYYPDIGSKCAVAVEGHSLRKTTK